MGGRLEMIPINDSNSFVLIHDYSHLHPEDEEDAILDSTIDIFEDVSFFDTEPISLSEIPVFSGRIDHLINTDFPICVPLWPIMSKKMIDTLLDIEYFPHKIFPIIITDYFTDQINEDYVVIQLLSLFDGVDQKKSIFETSDQLDWYITKIEKLSLNHSKQGFYPLFRLYQHPINLMISSKAQKVLIQNEIKGVNYLPVREYTFP